MPQPRFVLLMIAIVITTFAPLTHAEAPTAADRLARGHRHMDELEYPSAVHEFSVVLTDATATPAQQQEARLNAGIAHRYMENDVEARMLFLAALKRDPQVTLPPGDHPPKLVTFFDLVREEAAPPAPAVPTEPTPSDDAPAVEPAPVQSAETPDAKTEFNWFAVSASGVLVVLGAATLSAGIAADAVIYGTGVLGGGNAKLDAVDFLGPGAIVLGAVIAAGALAFIPFWWVSADPAEDD